MKQLNTSTFAKGVFIKDDQTMAPSSWQHQHEVEDLEGYSIETPTPPEFFSYEEGAAPVSYEENNASTNDMSQVQEDDDHNDFVRHGRSPRFWFLIVGALVIVAAVGGGVGAAMSKSSSSDSKPSAGNAATMEEELVEQVFGGLENAKENREADQAGAVVNLGNGAGNSANSNGNGPPSEVFDIILMHARFHGVEFKDPTSYQSLAVKWVEQTARLGVHTPERLVQRYALACIYYATNGVENIYTKAIFKNTPTRKWIDESGWLVADNECDWYRITCDKNGWVTNIELYSNRLTGQFPPEVALLHDTLEVVDLYQNMVHNSGDPGNHFLAELTNLRELFFGRTYFEYDGIPTYIGALQKLEEFDCSYTLYHGPLVGSSFAYLSNLEYLHIGGNRYNSSIPIELATLPKLEYFYAEYADVTGDLSFVTHMPAIVELWIDRNPFMEGTIPPEIGSVRSLQSFSITGCNLHGTLPPELANLRLQQFWAYNNSLHGTIPTEFGRVDSLVRLGLEGNNLYGNMPNEICQNRVPNGLLMKLESDCELGGTVQCAAGCCTCCGRQCSGS